MMRRDECFRKLAEHRGDAIVVAAYTSAFEWVAIDPSPLNFVSVGAMGQASSHALGLAIGLPGQKIVVLDGDGSLLMNLGSLVTIAEAAPENLVHFVVENGTYEANGGHPIPGRGRVDFAGFARDAGYREVHSFDGLNRFAATLPELLAARGPGLRLPQGRARPAAGIRLRDAPQPPHARRVPRGDPPVPRRRGRMRRAPQASGFVPHQTRKPCHVGVGRVKFGLMLDRQGGKMRVRRQIAGGTHRFEKREQNVRVTVSRVDDCRLRSAEPGSNLPAGDDHVERVVEDLGIRGDAHETQDGHPRKANVDGAVHQGFPPLSCGLGA